MGSRMISHKKVIISLEKDILVSSFPSVILPNFFPHSYVTLFVSLSGHLLYFPSLPPFLISNIILLGSIASPCCPESKNEFGL